MRICFVFFLLAFLCTHPVNASAEQEELPTTLSAVRSTQQELEPLEVLPADVMTRIFSFLDKESISVLTKSSPMLYYRFSREPGQSIVVDEENAIFLARNNHQFPFLFDLSVIHTIKVMISDEEIFLGFLPSLLHLKNLRSLSLSKRCLGRVEMGVKTIGTLATYLPQLFQLEQLSINSYIFSLASMEKLIPSLEKLENLRTLEFYWNNIDSRGVKPLIVSLKKLGKLESLCFYGTDLGPEGAETLVQTLPHLPNISSLDLGMTRSNVEALIKNLPCLQRIRSLHLAGIMMSPEQLRVLFSQPSQLQNLQLLDLKWSQTHYEELDLMRPLLRKLPALRIIYTDGWRGSYQFSA